MKYCDLAGSAIFHYAEGHVAKQTLTAEEMINLLAKFPPKTPVLFSWEGVETNPRGYQIMDNYNRGMADEATMVLMFDVDYF